MAHTIPSEQSQGESQFYALNLYHIFFEVFKKLTTGQEAPWTGFSMLIRFHVSVSPTGSEED